MVWDYPKEIEDEIIAWISNGKSVRSYCESKNYKPSKDQILRHEDKSKKFRDRCARARIHAGVHHAEDLDDINQMLMKGELDPQVAKVISSNKQWIASKLAPKRYGDVKTIKGDADSPIQVQLAGRLDSAINRIAKLPSNKQLEGDFIDVTSVVSATHNTDDD